MTSPNLTTKQLNDLDISTMSLNDIQNTIENLVKKVSNRREVCRKSSKQYYHKTYILSDEPTTEEVAKNKTLLDKRDNYQKTYYEKNAEKIKLRQKNYRLQRKQAKEAKKVLEEATIEENNYIPVLI